MGSEYKRMVLIAGAILVAGVGVLILPFMQLKIPQRPGNIPASALYAKDGGNVYWIDCPTLGSTGRFYCTVYSQDGGKLVQGVFQPSGVSSLRHVAFEGGMVHWKNSVILTVVHLDCVAGGRPPDVGDCRNSSR